MMKNILFICTLTALLSACSESRLFKKEEQYTPLCTYFNPLDLDMNIETLMPYFVNYSTDWAKMGLRSHPMGHNGYFAIRFPCQWSFVRTTKNLI